MSLNPFINRTRTKNVFFILKTILVGLVLLLPRLILFVLFMLLAGLVSKFITCCISDESLAQYPIRRPVLRYLLRICARVVLFSLGYHWITVHKPSKGVTDSVRAPIIVANHSSLVDAIYFCFADAPCFVAKSELMETPVICAMLRGMQTILVDRADKDSRQKVVADIVHRSTSSAWPPVLIFPEGTTTNQEALIDFKAGPFLPGCPVQPVVLTYKYWFLDPSFVGDMGPAAALLYMMCQVFNRLDVTYIPVYTPSEYERSHPKTFAYNVRMAMSLYKPTPMPLTSHSFDDALLQIEAAKLRLPLDGLSKMELKKDFPTINAKCGKLFVRRFAEINKDRNGFITLDEFRCLLEHSGDAEIRALSKDEVFVKGVFDLLDKDHDNVVNFRDFFVGMALLNLRTDLDHDGVSDALTVAFGLLDTNGDNVISCEELAYAVGLVGRGESDPTRVDAIVANVMSGCDTNGDGKVDLEEFVQYATRNPEIVAALVAVVKRARVEVVSM